MTDAHIQCIKLFSKTSTEYHKNVYIKVLVIVLLFFHFLKTYLWLLMYQSHSQYQPTVTFIQFQRAHPQKKTTDHILIPSLGSTSANQSLQSKVFKYF
jgi:hypothetical protein